MGVISPHRLKLSQIRALVAIADTGSFSDAALRMDLSQSAVSHAIATLEEELGVKLLSRSRQGAVLTPVGEQVTDEARQVLRALESICHKAKLSRGAECGQVRVAGFRSVATHILPDVIQRFRSKYPGVSVTIEEHQHTAQVEEDLRQGRADIGFTYQSTRPEFDTWELMQDRYLVLLPPGEPLHQPFTWEDLGAYPLIMRPSQDDDRQQVERHMARCGRQIQPAYVVKEDSTILSMVRRGLGATIITRLAAEPIPDGIRMVELPTPLVRVINIVMLKDALQPPPVFAFLDTLQKVWQQLPLALHNESS